MTISLPRFSDDDAFDPPGDLNRLAAAVETEIAKLVGGAGSSTTLPAGTPLVSPDELAALLDLDAGDPAPFESVCRAADAVVRRLLDEAKGPHDAHAHDREAAGAVAVQLWQARQAPGGQMSALDFAPVASPHLLGIGLTARIAGLVAPCRRYGVPMVVA